MTSPAPLPDPTAAQDGGTQRRVQRVHLHGRAARSTVALRAALEDALRTADFQDAGRLIVLRRLQLPTLGGEFARGDAGQAADAGGWAGRGGSPASASGQRSHSAPQLARALEQAWQQVAPQARPHDAVDAEGAPAVWFRSVHTARLAWVRQMASGAPPRAWFWPQALPEVARSAGDDRGALVLLLANLQASAPAALGQMLGGLPGDHLGRLLRHLPLPLPGALAAGLPAGLWQGLNVAEAGGAGAPASRATGADWPGSGAAPGRPGAAHTGAGRRPSAPAGSDHDGPGATGHGASQRTSAGGALTAPGLPGHLPAALHGCGLSGDDPRLRWATAAVLQGVLGRWPGADEQARAWAELQAQAAHANAHADALAEAQRQADAAAARRRWQAFPGAGLPTPSSAAAEGTVGAQPSKQGAGASTVGSGADGHRDEAMARAPGPALPGPAGADHDGRPAFAAHGDPAGAHLQRLNPSVGMPHAAGSSTPAPSSATAPTSATDPAASRTPATPGQSGPGTTAPRRAATPSIPTAPTASAAWADTPWLADSLPTRHGGLLMLLNALQALQFPAWLAAQPSAVVQRHFGTALLAALAQCLRLPADDPQQALLQLAEADHRALHAASLDVPQALAHWQRTLRRALRQHAGLGLARLVARPAAIAITPTHIDLLLPLDQVDLAVRRAGLDRDPGWLGWFGWIVQLHYLPGWVPQAEPPDVPA